MTKTELMKTYNIDTDDQNENNFAGLYDILIEYEIATEKELELVCSINGNNMDTLLSVLYVRAGLRSIEQLFSEIADENK
jgi:hypothetical protein